MLWLPGIDEKPFSIAGVDPLMFTVARVGPFSERLHDLGPGDTVWVRGPFGRGYTRPRGRALLVGGGYGAAPLFFLARELLRAGSAVEIALGARTAADLLFLDRFTAEGVSVHAATEDGSHGVRGRVTAAVGPLLASGQFDRLFGCGPEAMLESCAALSREAGVPAELSHEAYMRCGIGVCGACSSPAAGMHGWSRLHGSRKGSIERGINTLAGNSSRNTFAGYEGLRGNHFDFGRDRERQLFQPCDETVEMLDNDGFKKFSVCSATLMRVRLRVFCQHSLA